MADSRLRNDAGYHQPIRTLLTGTHNEILAALHSLDGVLGETLTGYQRAHASECSKRLTRARMAIRAVLAGVL